ncbi:ATP-binding protein [Silvimonas sp. JCM 19000]
MRRRFLRPLLGLIGATSIRTRLITAFLLLFGITLAVALVGITGMRANQRALDEYEANVVPEIARVLKLSEKVAQVAAVAPSMAGIDSPDLLRTDTEALQNLLRDIRNLQVSLPQKAEERLAAYAELDGIDHDLTSLMVQAGEQRQLQAMLTQQRARADLAGDAVLRRHDDIARNAPTLLQLWISTVAAIQANDAASLGRAAADSEALWHSASARGEDLREPALATTLHSLATGPDNVFATRHAWLVGELRSMYLVQLIRAHADQLDARSAGYVEELRQVAEKRHAQVRRVVASSVSGLLLLAVAGVVLALVGVAYVARVLSKLQRMTRVLARLAHGDTAQPIPAAEHHDEVGELARAFDIFRTNLLDKQKLLAGLDSQQRLLETVFRSMNDGVSIHDGAGRLVGWNPMFQAQLGLPAGRLRRGMSLIELRKCLAGPAHWRRVSRATATRTDGGRTRIASAAELHFNDQRILEFHCQGMPDGGWVAVCRDLTERRALEADHAQSQKMDVLGQLTGGVAHDFNNFLITILGNLELLQTRLVDQPEANAMAELAQRAALRASTLTRRLLAFARRQPLQAERVSIQDMLAEMLDLVEYAVGPEINVTLPPEDGDLRVEVDRGQLENAVLNLALNSAAAMPNGGTLSFTVARIPHPARLPGVDNAVVLSVRDTGSGIPTYLLDKVMEPFFTTRPAGEGSGLGLSSVYGFVKQSGGDMQLQSTVGAGTSVALWLPQAADAEEAEVPVAAPAPVRIKRMLVVEDDAEVRDTTLAMLSTFGVSAHGVSSANEAQRWLAEQGPVELVLSDISLGRGGNGIALAAAIAQRWPAIKVALMSGLPLESHRKHPAWQEGQPFLAKPFMAGDLGALLGGMSA